MPESTARRFKRPLTLFVAALLIALPLGLLAQQGRGGGQRGGAGAPAGAPAGAGAPPAAGGAAAAPAGGQGRGGGAQGAAGGARGAAPVDLTGTWVSIVTEDWIERMSPDSPRSGVGGGRGGGGGGGGGGRGGGGAGGGARGGVPTVPTTTDRCRVYAAGGSLRVPGRLNIAWTDDNTLKVEMDAGTQTRMFHFDAAVPPNTPKSLQGYSVATWEAGRGGGGGGGNRGGGGGGAAAGGGGAAAGGNRGGGAPPAPRWGSLKVVTTNLTGGYLLSSRDTYNENAVLTEHFTRHADFGMEYFTVTAVIEDGGNPRVTSSTFKKEPNGSKFAPTGCEIVK
jgi:hypothetical protein